MRSADLILAEARAAWVANRLEVAAVRYKELDDMLTEGGVFPSEWAY